MTMTFVVLKEMLSLNQKHYHGQINLITFWRLFNVRLVQVSYLKKKNQLSTSSRISLDLESCR